MSADAPKQKMVALSARIDEALYLRFKTRLLNDRGSVQSFLTHAIEVYTDGAADAEEGDE